MNLFEKLINNRKQHSAQTSIKSKPEPSYEKCKVEDYYDSVYTIETQHFQVIYVLTGPHATTKAFADSTAAILEDACTLLKLLTSIKLETTSSTETDAPPTLL